jgi:hypothetical protein
MIQYEKLLTLPGKSIVPTSDAFVSADIIFAYGELCLRREAVLPETAKQEMRNLVLLLKYKLHAPRPVYISGSTLLYTFIDGYNYEQLIDKWEGDRFSRAHIAPAFKALCRWLFSFYTASGKITGNIDLKNFVYTPAYTCAGSGFDAVFPEGSKEHEFGSLLALVATSAPSFTPLKKQIFLFILYLCYREGYDLSEIKSGYFAKIREISSRRPFHKNEIEKAFDFIHNLTSI